MEGGPWGIMIALSAFMIQVLAFGMAASIGVYNIELLEYFDNATVGVSLIGSINFGVFLGSGPIVSFLLTKFSYRTIALFGSALVVIGLLGMPLLPYIPSMCVCFGLLAGLGSCCVYIPSHVLSGLYYHKYRSLVTGVVTSGSGLGGAIMPILVGLLIQQYSWKGSLIFMSGLALHLFIFSALLRDPPATSSSKTATAKDSNIVPVENGSEKKEQEKNNYTVRDPSENPLLGHFDENVENNFTPVGENQSELIGINPQVRTNLSVKSRSLPGLNSSPFSHNHLHWRSGNAEGKFQNKCHLHLVDQEAFHTTSINCLHSAGLHGSGLVFVETKADNCWMGPRPMTPPEVQNEKQANSSRHIFIFTDYGFDVFFISNVMWNITAAIVISFGPEFLHHEGGCTVMEAAWLIGMSGFGCFIGGIFGGLLGNLKWVNRKLLYIVSNLVIGVCLIALPFLTSIVMYGVCLLIYGLAFGIILGLLVILLTDLVGVDSLVNGLGYLMLSNGLGSFSGPPIAGALKDATGSFWSMIILAGVLAIFAGLVMLLLPLKKFLHVQKFQRKK